jgi:isoamylase
MDSRRYWVLEMHVDGFRFDLASALARELHEVDRLGAFFRYHSSRSGVVVSKTDRRTVGSGRGGYQVGNFPAQWAEWNGVYRDTGRRFWKSDAGQIGSMAYRLIGSSDLYGQSGRTPHASIKRTERLPVGRRSNVISSYLRYSMALRTRLSASSTAA